MPTCAYHPQDQAVTTCLDCLKPICSVCFRYLGGHDRCAPCAAKVLRGRKVRNVILTAAGMAVVAVVAVFVLTTRNPFRYGEHSGRVDELRGRLEAAPCDAGAAVALGDVLLQAGANDEIEPMAKAFAARCGRNTQLLWKVYGAARQTGQWSRALAVATDLIEHDPTDKDYWWWRAIVHEQLGHHEAAISDYRKSLAIRPDLDRIPFNLATLYERLHRECEALVVIEQYLYWHPEHREAPTVRTRLERLQREGGCPVKVQVQGTAGEER